jgi:DNA-binding transcriptional LysR family regulator
MIDASPRRLQVFRHVVDLGGFNAAAAHLGIAQPSVGGHVKALERQVGHALLRRHRGVRPQLTAAGRVVYELAIDVIRRSEETAQQLASLEATLAREVVIGAHRDLAISFLPQRLARFRRSRPKSRIVTRIGTIEDVLALVESGAAQLGVLLARGPIRGLGSQVVGHEPLDLVVGRSHPLARRAGLAPADLAAFAFVTGLRNSRYFQIVHRALRSIGMTDYDVALELQEAVAVKEAVRHGQSIACLPRCTFRDEIEAGTLVALRLMKPLAPIEIRCVHGAPPGPVARRLITTLRG